MRRIWDAPTPGVPAGGTGRFARWNPWRLKGRGPAALGPACCLVRPGLYIAELIYDRDRAAPMPGQKRELCHRLPPRGGPASRGRPLAARSARATRHQSCNNGLLAQIVRHGCIFPNAPQAVYPRSEALDYPRVARRPPMLLFRVLEAARLGGIDPGAA